MDLSQAKIVLGLETFQGLEDLKKRFRDLAHQYHPDKNPEVDTTIRFREILQAYQSTLENISVLYREFGLAEEPDLKEKTARVVVENLDDIFEDIFGFSKSGRVLGYHEPQILYLHLPDFFLGAERKDKLVSYKRCESCSGIGAKYGTGAKICTHCFGQGCVQKKKRHGMKRKPCPKCHGRGRNIAVFCPECNGFGRLRQFHMQKFTLPVGMVPGEIYTLESYDTHTKVKAEIFLEPRLLRDPIFKIDNYNLLCEYHLNLSDHHRDVTLTINTPTGRERLFIQKGVRDGDVVTIPHAGLFKDNTRTKRGDLLITVRDRKKSFLNRMYRRLIGR